MIRIRFNRYLECQDPSDISSGDDCNQGLLTEVDSDFYQANYEGSKLRSILRKRQPCISLLSNEDEIVSDVTTTRKPPKMRKKKKSKRNQSQNQIYFPSLPLYMNCSTSQVYPTPQLFCPDHCDFNTFM